MKTKWMLIGAAAAAAFFSWSPASASSLNPVKWLKKPTASQQLAANSDEEKKLSSELQALLPSRTTLKDACSAFKTLEDCVASLHASHNLKIKFNCLKWNVTGSRPAGDLKSCEEPNRALTLAKAIRQLKPDADAHAEAKIAERRAREDIKDASS